MELRTEEWMKVYHKLAEQLKMIYQDHLKAVILYGSAARGTATEDSDIDIMVLVDLSPDRLKDYEEKLCEVSTDFALEYFKVFSIVDISYQDYEEWKHILPFYQNVSREGVTLYAA